MEKTYRNDIIKHRCPKSDGKLDTSERAAQFLSFEALAGFDDRINELKQSQTEKSSDSILKQD